MRQLEVRLQAAVLVGLSSATVEIAAQVGSDEEAIELMNDSPFGLTASIWTTDYAKAVEIGDRCARWHPRAACGVSHHHSLLLSIAFCSFPCPDFSSPLALVQDRDGDMVLQQVRLMASPITSRSYPLALRTWKLQENWA